MPLNVDGTGGSLADLTSQETLWQEQEGGKEVGRTFYALEIISDRSTSKVLAFVSVFLLVITACYCGVFFSMLEYRYFKVYACNNQTLPVAGYDAGCISLNESDSSVFTYNLTFGWTYDQGPLSLTLGFPPSTKSGEGAAVQILLSLYGSGSSDPLDLKSRELFYTYNSSLPLDGRTFQPFNAIDSSCTLSSCTLKYYEVDYSSIEGTFVVLGDDEYTVDVLGSGQYVSFEQQHFNSRSYEAMGALSAGLLGVFYFLLGHFVYRCLIVKTRNPIQVWFALGFMFFSMSGDISQNSVFGICMQFAPSLNANQGFAATSSLFNHISQFGRYLFLLCLVDAFKYETTVTSLPWKFYFPKIIVALFIFIVSGSTAFLNAAKPEIAFVNSNAGFAPGQRLLPVNTHQSETSNVGVSMYYIQQFIVFAVNIWTIILLYGILKHVEKTPYIKSRFKHLACRLIILLVTFKYCILIVTSLLIYTVLLEDRDLAQMFYLFTNIAGYYQYVEVMGTGYAFLPAKEDDFAKTLDMRLVFLSTQAKFCLTVAAEAYKISLSEVKLSPVAFGYEIIDVIREEETDTFVLVCRRHGKLFVGFRGTKSVKNLKIDLEFEKVSLMNEEWVKKAYEAGHDSDWPNIGQSIESATHLIPGTKRKAKEDRKVKVHGGFWKCHARVFDKVLHALRQPLVGFCDSVVITGHSLGGAIGTLCAFELAVKHRIPCEVYTFGSPRVGNKAFASLIQGHIPKFYQVCMDGDVITGLPSIGYDVCGTQLIMDRLGNILINPSRVERWFKIKSKTSISSHKMATYRRGLNKVISEQNREGHKMQLSLSSREESEIVHPVSVWNVLLGREGEEESISQWKTALVESSLENVSLGVFSTSTRWED
eukprot:Nk52_evm10s312 gene=Nk52_evmTU10s312